MRFFLICLLVLNSSSCAALFPIKVTDERTGITYTVPKRLAGIPGIKQLAEACVTKAERVIHRTVEVDGYFSHGAVSCDQACWDSFSQSPYEYMEFEVKKLKPWLYLKEKGLWRISKQEPTDARCGAKPTKYMQPIFKRRGKEMDFCLAFERVDELRSRYKTGNVYEQNELVEAPGFDLALSKNEIIELSSNEVIAFSRHVSLFLGSDFQSFKRSYNCSSLGIKPPGFESGRFLEYDVFK